MASAVTSQGLVVTSKWDKGDCIGSFMVTERPVYMWHPVRRSKKQWWYVGTCECGAKGVERSQADLREKRTRCPDCSKKSNHVQVKASWIMPADLPVNVPNFATLPAPSMVHKPDQYT